MIHAHARVASGFRDLHGTIQQIHNFLRKGNFQGVPRPEGRDAEP